MEQRLEIIKSVREMKSRAKALRGEGAVVGFVPTMGFLHEGHLTLVRTARELSDTVVVSIFVNPTQFGPNEDFEDYPRDLDRDIELLEAAGGDIVFVPEASDVYPSGFATVVHVQRMGEKLCGAFRPGHFDGVCTVVAKLFEIVRPSLSVFGQKDGQQVAIIERMVEDLDMGVRIIRGPIVREPDGLAMSSRNTYLSPGERAEAPVLHQALEGARERFEGGEIDAAKVLEEIRASIEAKPHAQVQYVAAVDWKSLDDVTELREGIMIALAVHFGRTRLIDNVVLGGRE
jgi:pantoate--beta-alanine ligase